MHSTDEITDYGTVTGYYLDYSSGGLQDQQPLKRGLLAKRQSTNNSIEVVIRRASPNSAFCVPYMSLLGRMISMISMILRSEVRMYPLLLGGTMYESCGTPRTTVSHVCSMMNEELIHF